jgi:hypothetical protein
LADHPSAGSSIASKVFDCLSSVEWLLAQADLAIIGPAGTDKSYTLIGLRIAAIRAEHKVRYFTAAVSSEPSTAASPATPSARSSHPCSVST